MAPETTIGNGARPFQLFDRLMTKFGVEFEMALIVLLVAVPFPLHEFKLLLILQFAFGVVVVGAVVLLLLRTEAAFFVGAEEGFVVGASALAKVGVLFTGLAATAACDLVVTFSVELVWTTLSIGGAPVACSLATTVEGFSGLTWGLVFVVVAIVVVLGVVDTVVAVVSVVVVVEVGFILITEVVVFVSLPPFSLTVIVDFFVTGVFFEVGDNFKL